ncbi:hypothetical protein L596_004685 [Steinernema carpocapsae]|uniref:GDNF/GAS1 domain-containing protein n=1 Tax=Steinernema carpocapsae TaxID=34508 RepID=A0A4U8UY31_STECR|nr:hypothetical protein L596_004685 [Steinernema carpocapsae]
MRWLILFPLLVLGACVDHRFQCKNKLAALKSVCGTSSAFCSATSLSDCVLKIRKITEAQHSQSFADFYCSEIRRYVQRHPCERRLRLAETNHASGVRLTRSPDAESIQRWRNQLRTDLHREVHTISQSNESCYHALYNNCLRHVSCRELWKIFRQLCTVDAQNQCQMTSKEDCWQSFEGISWTGLGTCTCFDDNSDCHWIRLQTNYNKCIYEIVQGHEEVEKIGSRQGAQKAKEVGSSSSQATPNNMYGTRKEYRPPSNSIQQHSTAQQQKPLSKRPGTAQNEKHFGSPTETQSPTTPPSSKPRGSPPRTHTSSQSRETFPIRPQPSNGNGNYATSHWRNQPNSFESQGSSVQGSESKESDPQRPNGHDPKSGFTGSRLDQEFFPTRAHIQIVPGAPQHGRVTLGTSSSDRRGQEASTDFRRPQGDSSSEGVQRNNDLIRVTNQDQSRMSGTQNSHRKEQVRVNQNSQRFKPTETVNNPVVSTSGHVRQMQTVSRNSGAAHTLSPTSAPIGVSVEEQRRRQHELFLMQQQERQFHEREMAAYRHRIAEEKKQREFEKAKLELGRKQQTLVRTKQKQEQEQENNGFLSPPRSFSGSHNSDFVSKHAQKPVSNSKWSTSTPRARTTSNSATISATVSESAHKFLVSSPAPSDTIFSSPLNLTMQQTSAEKKISSNRRVLQSLGNKPDWKPTDNPTSQKKKTRPTMRPPSWRLALIEDPNSSSSSVSEIVTTQTVSTNLEKPPTSPVMNSSTVGVTPSIKHVEENRNEEDNEDNDGYGGGLQFHSDVIFSKKKFQPADEDAYNEGLRSEKRRARVTSVRSVLAPAKEDTRALGDTFGRPELSRAHVARPRRRRGRGDTSAREMEVERAWLLWLLTKCGKT